MREVVIVEGCRTAVGRRKGAFAHYRADELFADVLTDLTKRANLDKGIVEDVIAGCVTQVGEQAMNIARTSLLIAGFPTHVPGVTIDRQCGSSQQAVHFAAQAIASGDMDIVIAGGVESMTRAPMFANVGEIKSSERLTSQHQIVNQGISAELIAGFPTHVPGVTIDRQCGSSQQAVHFAAQAIASGDMDIVIAGGVESMTRAPMFANVGEIKSSERLTSQHQIVNQGISAELIAEKWGFNRRELDEFSLRSHQLALAAIEKGKYQDEIVPIEVEDEAGNKRVFDTDEGPRRDTSLEVLGNLKPVFKEDGIVTAGNASQMSDGASAVLLMSREKADELGLKPKARIVARTVVGSDPTLMLTGPIAATKKVLEKANLTIADMDLYEVNEAFASVPLAWQQDVGADLNKLNVNGGAIALGHPLGATGTKLLVSLLNELDRRDGKYGLLAISEGMGMANATVIERI